MSDKLSEKNGNASESSERASTRLADVFAAVQNLSDGLLTVDRDNRITFMNPAAEAITGWSLAEAIGKPSGVVFRIVDAFTGEASWQPITSAMHDDARYTLLPNTMLVRKDLTELPIEDATSPIHDDAGTVSGAVITFRDVGTARALLRRVLERVHRDPLTGLPDRALLEDRFSQWKTAAVETARLALLYLDIDQFKTVNDTLGHLAGDVVLQTLAHRLRSVAPENGTVCRLGGDEFVVVLNEPFSTESVQQCVDILLRSAREPILFSGEKIEITISLGVLVQGKRLNLKEFLGRADKAMYRAKHAGGNKAEWATSVADELPLLGSPKQTLKATLQEPDVVLHYQPIVELATGRIVGAEALLRSWQSGSTATLPFDLISNAERSGDIVRLGQAVLRQALKRQAQWRELGFTDLSMNINVSAVELLEPSYLWHMDQILEEESYVPSCVTLELTESVLLQSEHQERLIKGLAERGLRIAIDDFGVGYSNLSYLRRFPINLIKIDREFLRQVPSVKQDSDLVRAIIAMAQSLGCNVIAEGVETTEQMLYLQELACPQAQGFLFSPPVTPERFVLLLQSRRYRNAAE